MLYKVVESTIAINGTVSDTVDLGNMAVVGLIIPTIDSGNLTFQAAAVADDTPVTVKNSSGSAIAITAGTGGFALDCDSLTEVAAYRWIRIVAATAQTSAAVTFKWVLKG